MNLGLDNTITDHKDRKKSYPEISGLDTIANSLNAHAKTLTSSQIQKKKKNRKDAFDLRHKITRWSFQVAEGKRVCSCGRVPVKDTDRIPIKYSSEGSHYFGAVQTCGSVWICPNCSFKIKQHRREQLREAIGKAQEDGFTIAFVTLTLHHDRSMPLKKVQRNLANSFAHFTNSRVYKACKKKAEISYCKSLEITYGSNGWHPHYHCLFAFKSIEEKEIESMIITQWSESVAKKHGIKVSSNAQDFQLITDEKALSNYLMKWDVMAEMQDISQKEGKGKTFFQMANEKNIRLHLLKEYVQGMHNQKQITYSRQWKEFAPKDVEKTDEELAEENQNDPEKTNLSLPLWHQLLRERKEIELLNSIEYDKEEIPDIFEKLKINVYYEDNSDMYHLVSCDGEIIYNYEDQWINPIEISRDEAISKFELGKKDYISKTYEYQKPDYSWIDEEPLPDYDQLMKDEYTQTKLDL